MFIAFAIALAGFCILISPGMLDGATAGEKAPEKTPEKAPEKTPEKTPEPEKPAEPAPKEKLAGIMVGAFKTSGEGVTEDVVALIEKEFVARLKETEKYDVKHYQDVMDTIKKNLEKLVNSELSEEELVEFRKQFLPDYQLTGSVAKAGDGLVVKTRILDLKTGKKVRGPDEAKAEKAESINEAIAALATKIAGEFPPPLPPAEKWAFLGADGKYDIKYTDSEHPLKKQSRGQLKTLRTYTAIPAPVPGKDLVAVFDTTKGKIAVKLFHDEAPQHVANMVYLSQQGFYKKTFFHRIMKGFMIQGGDPWTKKEDPKDREHGAGWFLLDEVKTKRKHVAGILSAAALGTPDRAPCTSGCQFFIMLAANSGLDGGYSIYGKVVEGMDIVNTIADTPCVVRGPRSREKSLPQEKIYLNGITIEER